MDTGSWVIASRPAIMMTIAMTDAKIGRPMKNWATAVVLAAGAAVAARGAGGGRGRGTGTRLRDAHLHARLDLLETRDHHAVAGREAVLHQPLVADRTAHLDVAHLDDVVVADDHHRDGVAAWVAGDAALRNQHGVLHD